MKQQLVSGVQDLLPSMPQDQWRRVRGEQKEIIVATHPTRRSLRCPSSCVT